VRFEDSRFSTVRRVARGLGNGFCTNDVARHPGMLAAHRPAPEESGNYLQMTGTSRRRHEAELGRLLLPDGESRRGRRRVERGHGSSLRERERERSPPRAARARPTWLRGRTPGRALRLDRGYGSRTTCDEVHPQGQQRGEEEQGQRPEAVAYWPPPGPGAEDDDRGGHDGERREEG